MRGRNLRNLYSIPLMPSSPSCLWWVDVSRKLFHLHFNKKGILGYTIVLYIIAFIIAILSSIHFMLSMINKGSSDSKFSGIRRSFNFIVANAISHDEFLQYLQAFLFNTLHKTWKEGRAGQWKGGHCIPITLHLLFEEGRVVTISDWIRKCELWKLVCPNMH